MGVRVGLLTAFRAVTNGRVGFWACAFDVAECTGYLRDDAEFAEYVPGGWVLLVGVWADLAGFAVGDDFDGPVSLGC